MMRAKAINLGIMEMKILAQYPYVQLPTSGNSKLWITVESSIYPKYLRHLFLEI